MSAVDTIGSVCMKQVLKDDKEWTCGCKKCSKDKE